MVGVFRAYDIRGVYPEEINETLAEKIGQAFVQFLGCKEVVVGRDARTSSESLFKALTKGITEAGANVIDIGLSSTPMFYYASRDKESGIMITASHNPAEYNGFKLVRENCAPISGDTGIEEIEKIVGTSRDSSSNEKGKIIKQNILEDYLNYFDKFISKDMKPFKVVVDGGNGMGGLAYPKLFKKLPAKLIPLYLEMDGTFPNHDADPLKMENVEDLQKKVIEKKADLGVALDGDCDRLILIDEKGNYISADLITALIAQYLLKDHPGENILYDLRSSWSTKEAIEEAGGKPMVCRVGHSFIKQQMKKVNALFAGELSGHFYFRDTFTAESSILTLIIVLNMLSETGKTLSELIQPFQKYFASGEINSEVKNSKAKIEELAKIYGDGTISRLDGLKIEFSDWWFNVRPSNTEPLLRLNLEAKNKELMEKKRDEVLKVIRS
ncbi:phosphomannomutase/phosphoglucomutase [Patescibacteria group bacterium]